MVMATLLGAAAPFAMADSISPTSFSDTLLVGETTTVHKTVTVSAGKPTTSKVDVYFLADTTGSMGGAINSVKSAASSILSQAAGLGDVQFAVGHYNGELRDSSYALFQSMTASQAAAQAGINSWFASGGGDGPEANLYGLYHAANDAATGWRPGSERILIWFGDAPGHDPSPGGTAPSDGKVTEAQATAALVNQGINVQAISVGFAQLNSSGQAQRIANATGGTLFNGISVANLVATITDAITTSVTTYNTVGIDVSEVPAGVGVNVVPSSHVGTFDRTVERTFEFDITFTGVTPGTYDFNVYGTVDGGRVATEEDSITVRARSTGVPDGGHAMLLLAASMGALGVVRRRTQG